MIRSGLVAVVAATALVPLSAAPAHAVEPSISIDDVFVWEPTGTVETVELTVSLSAPAAEPVTVDYTVEDAPFSSDMFLGPYHVAPHSGSLALEPGDTEGSIPLEVHSNRGGMYVGEFAYPVTLSNSAGAILADGAATLTVRNIDPGGGLTCAGTSGRRKVPRNACGTDSGVANGNEVRTEHVHGTPPRPGDHARTIATMEDYRSVAYGAIVHLKDIVAIASHTCETTGLPGVDRSVGSSSVGEIVINGKSYPGTSEYRRINTPLAWIDLNVQTTEYAGTDFEAILMLVQQAVVVIPKANQGRTRIPIVEAKAGLISGWRLRGPCVY